MGNYSFVHFGGEQKLTLVSSIIVVAMFIIFLNKLILIVTINCSLKGLSNSIILRTAASMIAGYWLVTMTIA